MITVKTADKTAYSNGPVDTTYFEFYGLSTDTKPITKYQEEKIRNTSLFYAMDTKSAFMYDEENSIWREQ